MIISQRWIVFDTETTGLLKPGAALAEQPFIIEIALAEVLLLEDGTAHRSHEPTQSLLIKPPVPVTDEITKITGITNDMLTDAVSFVSARGWLERAMLGVDGLLAHNLPFDLGMLTNELKRCGREFAFPYPPKQVCTVAAFTPEFGRRPRLVEIYERKLGRKFDQKHRAASDVDALVEVVLAVPEVLV